MFTISPNIKRNPFFYISIGLIVLIVGFMLYRVGGGSMLKPERSGSTSLSRQELISHIESASLKKDASLCESLPHKNQQKLCKIQVALKNKEEGFCEGLGYKATSSCKEMIRDWKRGKHYELAKGVCRVDDIFFTDCIRLLARRTNDASLCDLAPDGTLTRAGTPFSQATCKQYVPLSMKSMPITLITLLVLAPFIFVFVRRVRKSHLRHVWIIAFLIGGFLTYSTSSQAGKPLFEPTIWTSLWLWSAALLQMFLSLVGYPATMEAFNIFSSIVNGLIIGSIAGLVIESFSEKKRLVPEETIQAKKQEDEPTTVTRPEKPKNQTALFLSYAFGIGIYLIFGVLQGAFEWCKSRPHYPSSNPGYSSCVIHKIFLDPFLTTFGIIVIALTVVLLIRKARPRTVFIAFAGLYGFVVVWSMTTFMMFFR